MLQRTTIVPFLTMKGSRPSKRQDILMSYQQTFKLKLELFFSNNYKSCTLPPKWMVLFKKMQEKNSCFLEPLMALEGPTPQLLNVRHFSLWINPFTICTNTFIIHDTKLLKTPKTATEYFFNCSRKLALMTGWTCDDKWSLSQQTATARRDRSSRWSMNVVGSVRNSASEVT